MKTSKFSIENRKEYKLSEESALNIVLDLCEHFDLDVDTTEDNEKRSNLEDLLSALTDFVRRGLLEVNEDFGFTQHLQNGEKGTLEYKTITGQQKLAMDGYGKNENMAKAYAILGAACGQGDSLVKKLKGIDLKVAEALTVFFI